MYIPPRPAARPCRGFRFILRCFAHRMMVSADSQPPSALPPPVEPRLRRVGLRRPFASFRTIAALILREMGSSYGRTPGGYAWAILEPVGGIAILSFIFSVMFRNPPLGISFPLFYATGMLPFMIFSTVNAKVAQALTYSRPLLAYPSVTFVDAILARFILNFLTDLMVAYIVFTGIILLFDTRVILHFPSLGLAFALAGALALGVGTLNCFLTTAFPIWQQAWSILMRPMFILSGVLFIFDSIPEPLRSWIWYNPLIHVVGLTRRGIYASYDASYASPAYVLGIAGACGLAGLLLLWRYHRLILQR